MEDKYLTLVFELNTKEEYDEARALAMKENCRAWSLDHELLRLSMIEDALEQNNISRAKSLISADTSALIGSN